MLLSTTTGEAPPSKLIKQTINSLSIVESDYPNKQRIVLDGYDSGFELALIHELGVAFSAGNEIFDIKLNKDNSVSYIHPTKHYLTLFALKHCSTEFHHLHIVSEPIRQVLMIMQYSGYRYFDELAIEKALTSVKHAAALNKLAKQVGRKLRTDTCQARTHAIFRNAKKNRKSLQDYIDGLFDRHARLCVIRLDLSYAYRQGEKVSLRRAVNDHKSLMVAQSKHRLFKHLRGYTSKLHYGEDKGYHYHLAYFFDGSKVHKHVHIANEIGKLWQMHLTDGLGCYHNCNLEKPLYEEKGQWALGLVDHHDKEKRRQLHVALKYLTSADQYVKAKLTAGARVYQRGVLPVLKKESRGRRRFRG